jgi:membrane-associated phospholipid phosphatase
MKNHYLLLLLLVVQVFNAQQKEDTLIFDESQKTMWQTFTYDFGNIFKGMGYAYSRPLYWKGEQFKNFGYIAAGTSALYLIDDDVDDWANGWRNDVPQFIKDYGNDYAGPNLNFRLTGAVYLVGLFTKNEKLRRTGVLLVSSAAAGGLLQQVSKRIIGRGRPRANVGKGVFDPFHIDRVYNFDSFPSGHTILGFTNAYILAKHFDNKWLKAGLYTVGSIPGMVRIIDRFHWLSDVVFSTAISVFIVEAVDKFLDKKYDKKYNDKRGVKKNKMVSWDLQMTPRTFGIAMRF